MTIVSVQWLKTLSLIAEGSLGHTLTSQHCTILMSQEKCYILKFAKWVFKLIVGVHMYWSSQWILSQPCVLHSLWDDHNFFGGLLLKWFGKPITLLLCIFCGCLKAICSCQNFWAWDIKNVFLLSTNCQNLSWSIHVNFCAPNQFFRQPFDFPFHVP